MPKPGFTRHFVFATHPILSDLRMKHFFSETLILVPNYFERAILFGNEPHFRINFYRKPNNISIFF